MYLFKLVFLFFPDIYSGVDLLYHMVVLFLIFLKNFHTVFQLLHQVTFPPAVHKGSLFSISLPAMVICGLFDDSHSDRNAMITHCSFD